MTLILVRHAESIWNSLDLFTGWEDVTLTQKGLNDSFQMSELLESNEEFKKEAEKLRKDDQEKLKELDTLYTRIKQRISI